MSVPEISELFYSNYNYLGFKKVSIQKIIE